MVDVPSDKQSAPDPAEVESNASSAEPASVSSAPAETSAASETDAEHAKRASTIAGALRLNEAGVAGALALFDAGYAVPYVAWYRRAETENLSEGQLENVYEAYLAYRSLADRRKAILQTLSERGVLSDRLRDAINAAQDKIELEDLYLPLKRRERTKATIAVDKGLGPLADLIRDPEQDGTPLEELAQSFVRPEKQVNAASEALEGAREILCEAFAHDPELRRELRSRILSEGRLTIHATNSPDPSADRFKNFYGKSESLSKIAPQRFLQIMRGVRTAALRTTVEIDDAMALDALASKVVRAGNSPAIALLRECLRAAYDQTMRASAERDAMTIMQERSDAGAIRTFRENARNRLMASPAGGVTVLGMAAHQHDTIAWAVVDPAGKTLDGGAVKVSGSEEFGPLREAICNAVDSHEVRAIAIGRGDRSGAVLRVAREALGDKPIETCYCTIVQEAHHPAAMQALSGPSEDPGVAVAAAIARQHQDPLKELVKLDPRHIGIGQNFHEVNQKRLREALQRVITSCVCRIGLNLNEAGVELLSQVCGVQPATAENIVKRRDEEGPFKTRRQLLDVAGVGPKVYEQAAPFLRIADGEHALDAFPIHPTQYEAVENAAKQADTDLSTLAGDEDARTRVVDALNAADRALADSVRHAFRRGTRDPRGHYRPPNFLPTVRSVADLEPGAVLEGVVTNVADFGAFVEVGVGQDGLVHLSELANSFVRDPRQVVSVGQTVRVKVLQVDTAKPRISLSIKALQPQKSRKPRQEAGRKPAPERAQKESHGKREDGAERKPKRRASQQRPRDAAKPGQRRPKDRGQRAPKKTPIPIEQDNEPLTNTLLADQLEALKDRLGA